MHNALGSPGTPARASTLSHKTPTKLSQRPGTPSTPNTCTQHGPSESNIETASELGETGDTADLGSQLTEMRLEDTKKEPENPLTQAEVDMMAELWDGRDVCLVGTK